MGADFRRGDMKNEKDVKSAKEKKIYIGPRVTVLSPKSEKAIELVNEVGSESGDESQDGNVAKPQSGKSKKRLA